MRPVQYKLGTLQRTMEILGNTTIPPISSHLGATSTEEASSPSEVRIVLGRSPPIGLPAERMTSGCELVVDRPLRFPRLAAWTAFNEK